MGYRLRQIEVEGKYSSQLGLEAISLAVPMATVTAVLDAEGAREGRERKLGMGAVVLLLIAMNLYTHLSMGHVLRKLCQGLRFVWPDPGYKVAGASAITYRRYQLGARPLATLFRKVCRPLATADTPGAFLFGLRLMAIDGTVEDMPDTAENVAVFGRSKSHRGGSAWAQVQGIYLAECGTRAVVDAGFWPYNTSERSGAFRLLRSVVPGMLLMWDRGFHEYDLFVAVRGREAHVLGRVGAHVKLPRIETLPDGSYLSHLLPYERKRRATGEHLVVRVVEYTLTDPDLSGHNERHRLITTLLDPELAPAVELVCAYHERWEVELAVDEMDNHQRLAGRPLRSRKPVGVIQELYALLIAHYVVRATMHQAARSTGTDPDRLSFAHAVRVIADAIPEFEMVDREDLPRLYTRLLADIAAGRLPVRRNRSNPRVVKRKMSNFLLKRPAHYTWPQPAIPFRQAVALI